jgi:hypothetical protein
VKSVYYINPNNPTDIRIFDLICLLFSNPRTEIKVAIDDQKSQWIDAKEIEEVQSLLEICTATPPEYLYSGLGDSTFLPKKALPIFIARDPQAEHLICKHSDVFWQDWKSNFDIFNEVQHFLETHAPHIAMPECITDSSQRPQQDFLYDYEPVPKIKHCNEMSYISDFKQQYITQGGRSYQQFISFFQRSLVPLESTFFLPSVGHFSRRGNRFHFTPTKLLRNRLLGKTSPEHRRSKGRFFGGEGNPASNIHFWAGNQKRVSKRRQLVIEMSDCDITLYRKNSVNLQAFTDSLIFHLVSEGKVVIANLGTLRYRKKEQKRTHLKWAFYPHKGLQKSLQVFTERERSIKNLKRAAENLVPILIAGSRTKYIPCGKLISKYESLKNKVGQITMETVGQFLNFLLSNGEYTNEEQLVVREFHQAKVFTDKAKIRIWDQTRKCYQSQRLKKISS